MSDDIKECAGEDICRGGNDTSAQCREGHRGPYCSICVERWFEALDERCNECEGGLSLKFYLVALAVLAAIVAVVVGLKKLSSCMSPRLQARAKTVLKVLFVSSQILVEFEPVFGVRFPAVFGTFLDWLSIPALSFFSLTTGLECAFPDINYHSQLYLTTLGPVGVIVLLAGVNEALVLRGRGRSNAGGGGGGGGGDDDGDDGGGGANDSEGGDKGANSWATDDSDWTNDNSGVFYATDEPAGDSPEGDSLQRQVYAIAIFVLYVMLPPASQIAFRTFACERLDEEVGGAATTVRRLREDYSIDCDSTNHMAAQYYAMLMVAIWPVGVPLSFAVLLFYHRRNLKGLPAEAAIGPAEDHVGEKDAAAAESMRGSKERFQIDALISRHEELASQRRIVEATYGAPDAPERCSGAADGAGALTGDEELLQNRNDDRSLDSFRLLFDAYAPHAWYWEIIVTIRRLFMTGVLVLFEQGSVMQLSLGLFSCFGSALLQSGFCPYHDHQENGFALIVEINLLVMVFTAYIGMLDPAYLEGDEGHAIGVFLVILTAIAFALGGVIFAYELKTAEPLEIPDGGLGDALAGVCAEEEEEEEEEAEEEGGAADDPVRGSKNNKEENLEAASVPGIDLTWLMFGANVEREPSTG